MAQDFDFDDEEQDGDDEKLVGKKKKQIISGTPQLLPILNYLLDHDLPLNVDAMNMDFIRKSQEVWDVIEEDRYPSHWRRISLMCSYNHDIHV